MADKETEENLSSCVKVDRCTKKKKKNRKMPSRSLHKNENTQIFLQKCFISIFRTLE